MKFITRPLSTWPRPQTAVRRRGMYSLSYDRVLRHLERELINLKVKGDVVIQLDVQEHEIREDGLLRASARPRSPRVAIAFSCKHGPLTYYCDAFYDWQSNVRAIGLGMERLRMVEQTGIVSRGEQYTGFRALPGGIPMPAAEGSGCGMTVEVAALLVAEVARRTAMHVGASDVLANPQTYASAYRAAVKMLHPDAGGTHEEWNHLQRAAEVLDKHHGGRKA